MVLERLGANGRHAIGGRQQVIGERGGEKLTLVVVNQVFEQRAAKTLHDRAHGLAVQRQRIDDAADILDRGIVEDGDVAGGGIDRDMRRVRAIGIGAAAVAKGRLGGDAGESGEGQRFPVPLDLPVRERERSGRNAEPARGFGQDFFLERGAPP